MKKITLIAVAIATLAATATQYSKLAIITAAKQSGKWPALKAWITEAGYWDEWLVASYLSDDFPQYPAITNAIVSSGIVTDGEVRRILAASVDPAVSDALQRRRYDADMGSESGRQAWHGGRPVYEYDWTNCLKIAVYPDGYTVTNKWQRPKTPEERAIEEAARKRKAAEREVETARKTKPSVIADIIAARVAAETNAIKTVTVDSMTGEVVK